ncbi:MAG: hypothetical protein SNJ75_16270, partial [Gemmataceae bacterium]
RTVSFGPPTPAPCQSCESRFTPIVAAPAPSAQTIRPPLADPRKHPPIADEVPPIRLGEPRVKVESKTPPIASVPGPGVLPDEPSPIDLPAFTQARPGVTSGLQPFPDGQDWLASKGYKTVLHLRGTLDDTAAISRQYEKKGITYQSIIVSPATLTKEKVEEFAILVEDSSKHPLHVFDKDGAAAGAMWYLYFRLHRKTDEQLARKEAARLGLREEDEEQKTYWIAIQNLLKDVEP